MPLLHITQTTVELDPWSKTVLIGFVGFGQLASLNSEDGLALLFDLVEEQFEVEVADQGG